MTAHDVAGSTRRVVTGVDASGRSTIISDAPSMARLERPGGATVTEVWRADVLPALIAGLGPLDDTTVVSPAPAGFAVRVCTFPPDQVMSSEAYESYERSIASSYGDGSSGLHGTDIPGMHKTETVDVVVVLSGELWVVTQEGERRLRPGDSVVQRGTLHAWQNRSDETASVVAVMMGGTRD